MIIAKTEYGDKIYNTYSKIPAFILNGVLIIGHNGDSAKYPSSFSPIWYDSEDFKYFCDHRYQGADMAMPQFLYKGKIPYELMRVTNGYNTLYTFLTPCRDNTYFCKCNDCGTNFVIDCYQSSFFTSKNLTVPTIRCPQCIKKRKWVNSRQ